MSSYKNILGRYLLSCSDDKTLRTWHIENKRNHKTLSAHNHFVQSIGKFILSTRTLSNIEILLCDRRIYNLHSDIHRTCAHCATGSVDTHIKIWDCR